MSARIAGTGAQDIAVSGTRKNYLWPISAGIFCLVTLLIYGVMSLIKTAAADDVLARHSIRTATVVRGDLIREVIAQGRIVAANSPTLFSPEQGHVQLFVNAGDGVSKDELVARIDSPQLQEQLAQERAHLLRLQSGYERQKLANRRLKLELQQKEALAGVNLQALRREKRRADSARSLRVISEFDHQEALDNVARAELEHMQSLSNLELESEMLDFDLKASAQQAEQQRLIVKALERRIARLDIRSPVDGMIGGLAVQPQQAIIGNQALMTVIDLEAMELEARVPENTADELGLEMSAHVKLNGESYEATVKAISPEVANGEVITRIAFAEEPPAGLRQNQRLSARISLQHIPNTLILERGAFFDDFGGHVFKVQNDSADRTAVILGASSLRHVEVLEGLAEGDTVVISAINAPATAQQLLISN